jgi:hypothetical protein
MSTDVTNFESYPSSKTSLQALRDRTDHRIRIRIAELKQLYYGQELIPPSKMGTDIVCSVLILEKGNVEEEGIIVANDFISE